MAVKRDQLIFQLGIEGEENISKVNKALDKMEESGSATALAIKQLKKEQREEIKLAELQKKATEAQAGSYDSLSAQYSINRSKINGLSKSYLENTEEGQKLIKETAAIRVAMNDSQKATNNMTLQVGDYRDETKAATEQTSKFGLVGKKTFGVLKKVGKVSFKAIGTAIKGMGIGLLLGLFTTLFEALKQNQKVMDLFEQATNAIGIVVTPLAEGIAALVDGLVSGSEEFDAFGRVVGNVIKIALTPLKLTFYTVVLLIKDMNLLWLKAQKVFGKEVDTKAIEDMAASIQKTKDNITELKESTSEAYKGIIKDAKEAYGEMKVFGKDLGESVKKAIEDFSYEDAKAAEQAKKNVERLETARDVAHKQGMFDAEALRQLRDDITLSYEDRIQANKDLGIQLEKQRSEEHELVMQQIAEQEKVLAVQKDNEEALQKMAWLKYQLVDIEEDIIGMLAEQKVEENALAADKLANDAEILAQKIASKDKLDAYVREGNAKSEEELLLKEENDAIRAEEARMLELQKELDFITSSEEEKNALIAQLEAAKLSNIDKIKDKYRKVELEKDKKLVDQKKQLDEYSSNARAAAFGEASSAITNLLGQESAAGKAAALVLLTVEKVKAISSIISNTAIANAAAVAASPLTLGQPWVGINTVTSGISIGASIAGGVKAAADIAGLNFATGGIVPGTSLSGDNIKANVNSKEMILTQEQQAQLFNQANGGGSSSLNADLIAEAVIKSIRGIDVSIQESAITEKQKEVLFRESKYKA